VILWILNFLLSLMQEKLRVAVLVSKAAFQFIQGKIHKNHSKRFTL